MAYECEADDANCLKHSRTENGEALRRVALVIRRDVRALDEYRGDDDDHANEGET